MRTRPCDRAKRQGRLNKAEEFGKVAGLALAAECPDAYVVQCVHAGIAAADVICCARLGEHAQGESHTEAVALLRSVDQDAAKFLNALLALKTKAGYTDRAVGTDDVKRAGRAAGSLLEAARRAHID